MTMQCFNNSFTFAANCTISPTVASENNTYIPHVYPAASALTDDITDGIISEGNGTCTMEQCDGWLWSYWISGGTPASFVIDLGCSTMLTEVHFRQMGSLYGSVKDFIVEIGDTAVGPWTKVAEGQLLGFRDMVARWL